jgi:septum site-determining protein MinC
MQEPLLSNAAGGPLVSIQGSHGSFIITLDSDAEFEALRGELRRVLSLSPDTYKLASARLDIGTRRIALFDIRRLMSLMKEEFGLQTTALYCTQKAVLQYAEHELKLRVIAKDRDEPTKPPEPAIEGASASSAGTNSVIEARDPADTSVSGNAEMGELSGEERTAMAHDLPDADLLDAQDEAGEADGGRRILTIDRTLRSGAIVRFPGDVTVFGDVNAGAQVEAAGNIIVLGALRGLAHAGSHGDERSVIVSFDLRPTQIRIGAKIAMAPDEKTERIPRLHTPEIAWVEGDRVVIEEYRGRLPA